MIVGGNIPELLECVDAKSFRVHAPAPVVFICGGPCDVKAIKPMSLRDAFMRLTHKKPFDRHITLLAEELNAFFPRGHYKDILSLEADIAQISDLIILFSESFGSAAELGAFAMVPDIAPRLLVVIDDHHYEDNSFIKLGPIRSLENAYGERAICVLNRADIKIDDIRRVENLDLTVFSERIAEAFSERVKTNHERTTFDKNRNGHIIKLVAGLIQHYGALTLDEIDVLLYCLDIKIQQDRLSDLLLCAEFAEWIIKDKRGLYTYYLAVAGNEALQYSFLPNISKIDKFRWRATIAEYWKQTDPNRFSSITYAAGHKSK